MPEFFFESKAIMNPQQAKPQQEITGTYVRAPPTPEFDQQPIEMTCPHCRALILTRTETQTSAMQWIFSCILCVFLCCCCAAIPLCIESLKDVKHYCPRCNQFLGRYKGGDCWSWIWTHQFRQALKKAKTHSNWNRNNIDSQYSTATLLWHIK